MSDQIYNQLAYGSIAFMQGYKPKDITNTTVTFSPGSARCRQSDYVIQYPTLLPGIPGEITVDTTTVGINGVYPLEIADAAPVSGVALLKVYAIANSSGTTSGSLSQSSGVVAGIVIGTAETGFVPEGYDTYVQIGVVVVDNSGNLVPFVQNGNGNVREIMFQDAVQILNAGTSASLARVDIDLLDINTVQKVNINYLFTPNATGDIASVCPYILGVTPTTYPIRIKASAAAAIRGNFEMPVGDYNDGTPAINYILSSASASLTLYVSGFTYSLPFVVA